MKSGLAITKQPTSVTVANGEKAATTVTATGEGLTYTWYYTSNKAGAEFFVSSVTGATYSTTMDATRDGRKVYCVITDKYGNVFVDGISSNGGSAEFTVDVPERGEYRLTLNYANNLEGGYHAYNVDLIEALLTVTANGESKDIFCRNTYSLYTYKTLTFNLLLEKGENKVVLTNSGNVLFADNESFAPRIESITISSVN